MSIDINETTIGELNKGSFSAFDILYQRYHKVVYSNISKFILQADIAEDILQDVFMALWENRSKMDPSKDIGGWLFVVSYNKSIAFLKKRVNENIIFTENFSEAIIADETAITGSISEIQLKHLKEAINSLSPRKRKVFQLCRLEGKSYSEAAIILGLSNETIKEYMKDSMKFVRNFIFSKYTESSLISLSFLSYYLQS
jgi:RNA polymerase sigma-70 factor (ECF subfamily)